MPTPHLTRSASHVIMACTAKRVFFHFEPHEGADMQQEGEEFKDYAARICNKFGLLALEDRKSETVTYWSE